MFRKNVPWLILIAIMLVTGCEQFVYDVDFANAIISLNKVSGEETFINNLLEVYPQENHAFVDYHVKDSSADGRNWSSLRLVFEKIGQDHILVGVIHDSWTPY